MKQEICQQQVQTQPSQQTSQKSMTLSHVPKQVNSYYSYTCICFRHSSSKHNHKKNQQRSVLTKQQAKQYKNTEEYKKIKYSHQFIDSNEINSQLLQNNLENIHILDDVTLIIISPLGRCLQTCKQLLKYYDNKKRQQQKDNEKQNNSKKIKVIVEPLITSRISTAWSTGKTLEQKIKEYPDYDYEEMMNCQPQSKIQNQSMKQSQKHQKHWIYDLFDEKMKNAYKKETYKTQDLLDFISHDHPQPYANIMTRIRKFKQKLQNYKKYQICEVNRQTEQNNPTISQQNINFNQINKLQLKSKRNKILIISHSCIFKYIVGTRLTQKGKVDTQNILAQFDHCDPIYYKGDYILNETYLKPMSN